MPSNTRSRSEAATPSLKGRPRETRSGAFARSPTLPGVTAPASIPAAYTPVLSPNEDSKPTARSIHCQRSPFTAMEGMESKQAARNQKKSAPLMADQHFSGPIRQSMTINSSGPSIRHHRAQDRRLSGESLFGLLYFFAAECFQTDLAPTYARPMRPKGIRSKIQRAGRVRSRRKCAETKTSANRRLTGGFGSGRSYCGAGRPCCLRLCIRSKAPVFFRSSPCACMAKA